MINAGIDLVTVGALLGRKHARSTKRYSHLATVAPSDAIGKIAPHQQKNRLNYFFNSIRRLVIGGSGGIRTHGTFRYA